MSIDTKQQSNGLRNESDTIMAREIADIKIGCVFVTDVFRYLSNLERCKTRMDLNPTSATQMHESLRK